MWAETKQAFTAADGRELFSFGNGCFYEAADAQEYLNDGDGRWLSVSLTLDSYIIVEKRKLFSHLVDLPCVETSYRLRDVLRMLADAGEVWLCACHAVHLNYLHAFRCAEANIKVSHHDFDLSKDFMEQSKKLVFVIEDMKERPKKKQKKQDTKA